MANTGTQRGGANGRGLKNLMHCPSMGGSALSQGGKGECGGSLWINTGLDVMSIAPVPGMNGANIERFDGAGAPHRIWLCARCDTPYALEAGNLIDLSADIGKDLQGLMTRGWLPTMHRHELAANGGASQ